MPRTLHLWRQGSINLFNLIHKLNKHFNKKIKESIKYYFFLSRTCSNDFIILFKLIISMLRNTETNRKLSPSLLQNIVKVCFCNYHIKYSHHNLQSPCKQRSSCCGEKKQKILYFRLRLIQTILDSTVLLKTRY